MRQKVLNRLEHYRRIQNISQKRIRNKIRDKIKEIKTRTGCMLCPEKHPAALCFHHRDPVTKEFSIQKAVSSKVPWDKVIKEIEKCDVLCANCHAKLHYEEQLKKERLEDANNLKQQHSEET